MATARVRHGSGLRHLAAVGMSAVLLAACAPALPSSSPTGLVGSPPPSPAASRSTAVTVSPAPSPTASPTPVTYLVPLVPVVAFWSPQRSISRAALVAALQGAAGAPAIAVSADELSPLTAALGLSESAARPLTPPEIRAFVRGTSGAIGLLRADDVTMDVRALAIDGVALFGAERVKDVTQWPLVVASAAASSFGDGLWTLAAGGDVMLDKDAYNQAIVHDKGVSYPWDGGTAKITGRVCCGWGGGNLVQGARTGNSGAVRRLLTDADVAIANLEAPAAEAFTYHAAGFTFSVDPRMLAGLKDAGIDAVSLANNHMGNAGTQGVLDTVRHLDELGIAHVGAGSDAAAARKPAWLDAGGLRVAFLAYSDIQPDSYFAGTGHPGTAAYSMTAIKADIAAARAEGADFVIVMPHWGIEYSDALYDFERPDAKAMIAAGADIVLASHSHWVGPMEAIDASHVAFYSLGDFVFDWTHDERTQEGVIVDLTFSGTKLVQIDLHPTAILDGAQPNLLDPATDGQSVLEPMRHASKPFLGW